MNSTAAIWLVLFAFLCFKGFNRPIWLCCAYIQTFFAAPPFWWWGKGVLSSITLSWNLFAAVLLLVSVLINWGKRQPQLADDWARNVFVVLGICLANATFVHFLLASRPEHSWFFWDLMAKQTVICMVLYYATQSSDDLKIFLLAIMFGCAFVGFEVVYGGQGYMERGRLEGVRMPGASDSNGMSGALSMGLPIAGFFLLQGKTIYIKIAAVGCAVLVLETLLRCNSRGAYLGCIAAGVWLVLSTSGKSRLQAIGIGVLGVAAFLMQAKNEAIWTRLFSVTADKEVRDNSAQERLNYWEAGLKMISQYPLGSGGEAAFMSPLGKTFIAHMRDEFRAVHNGYIDIAASWGVQGLFLFLAPIGLSFYRSTRVKREVARAGHAELVLLIGTIQAILLGQAMVATFISSLDNEWFYWVISLLLLACNVDSSQETDTQPEGDEDEGSEDEVSEDEDSEDERTGVSNEVSALAVAEVNL